MAGSATTVGKVQYVVDVDTKGLDKGLSDAETAVSKSEGKLSKGFAAIGKAAAAGLAVAATAVAGLAISAVKGFADYEQLTGGVETLFKDSSDAVMGYAENAYKTAGLSANQYMETITGFSASLLQGLGGDTAEAARIGDMAVTDMADNANKMGTSIDLIQNAYQGFAKDNFTMLDNLKLGYGGTASEMARLVNDSGVMGDSFKATAENVKDIPFDQLILAIHKTQDEMGITGTTAKEASETISGSIGTMKASWSNLVTGLADENANFDQLLSNFVESAGNVMKNLVPVIKTALTGIVQLISELAPILIAELPALLEVLIPAVIQAALQIIMAIVEVLPSLIETIFNALVTILPTLIDALIQLIPKLLLALTNLIITIVQKLTEPATLTLLLNGAIQMFLAIVQAIPQIILALVDALPNIIDNIIQWLTDPNTIMMLINAAVQLFMGIVAAIPKIIGALIGAFGSLFKSLWDGIVNIFTGFGGKVAGAIGDAIKGGINGILGIIEGAINLPFNLINGAIDIINLVPGVNIGKIPTLKIPRLYMGGIVEPGGRIIHAGDGGEDEWVVPESKMASLMEQLQSAGAGQPLTINVYGTFATSASEQRRVAQQIADQLEIINRTRMGAMS